MSRAFRQLARGLGVLWGSLTLVFLIFSQVPDPARSVAGQHEDPAAIAKFRLDHGLDLSLGNRYMRFLEQLSPVGARDDGQWGWKWPSLGNSYFGERPVGEALAQALPATLLLASAAMGLALLLGITTGLVLAWHGDGPLARAVIGFATLGMSAPSFFVAILVAWLFGVVWHEHTGLPATGGWRVIDPFLWTTGRMEASHTSCFDLRHTPPFSGHSIDAKCRSRCVGGVLHPHSTRQRFEWISIDDASCCPKCHEPCVDGGEWLVRQHARWCGLCGIRIRVERHGPLDVPGARTRRFAHCDGWGACRFGDVCAG